VRKKKVWRYYCDFCKKSGCSGGHLKNHEARCTMNPNRSCGMCEMFEECPRPIDQLLAILPDPKQYMMGKDEFGLMVYVGLEKAVEEAMSKLREATENCPACILATFRQKGIPVPAIRSFNFKKECEAWWDLFNDDDRC